VRKIQFGLKGARNYFWYRAWVNLSTALAEVVVQAVSISYLNDQKLGD